MRLGPRAITFAAISLVAVFAILLAVLWFNPPSGEGFRAEMEREAGKVALQMLGISLLTALFAELLRVRSERADLARRVRRAYSKAKRCRRRLKRTPRAEHGPILERLEGIQLDLEDLRDEAARLIGPDSKVKCNLKKMEEYLRQVVKEGLTSNSAIPRETFADFLAHPDPDSGFSTKFRIPLQIIRQELR